MHYACIPHVQAPCRQIAHPVGRQHLALQRVAKDCKPPQLVGDVLSAQHRNVHQDAVVDEVQQFAVAHIELGHRPAHS